MAIGPAVELYSSYDTSLCAPTSTLVTIFPENNLIELSHETRLTGLEIYYRRQRATELKTVAIICLHMFLNCILYLFTNNSSPKQTYHDLFGLHPDNGPRFSISASRSDRRLSVLLPNLWRIRSAPYNGQESFVETTSIEKTYHSKH